jgi:hypothetical protein
MKIVAGPISQLRFRETELVSVPNSYRNKDQGHPKQPYLDTLADSHLNI